MDALRELVQLVTRNKLKSIDVLDFAEDGNSRLGQLYNLISEGKVETDQQAAEMLYPESDNTSGYRKLKNKLRKKLINSLLLVDLNQASYSDRKSAYHQCYKEWAAIRILLAKNAWTIAVEIAERILKHSMKYEFTELTLDLLGIMRLHYGTRLGDLKKFEEYKRLALEYEPIYIAENKAEMLYTELIVHYVNNKSTKTNLQKKAELALMELSDSLRRFNSYRLHLYGGMIRLMISSTVNKHEDTISTCEDLIEFFESKDYRAETPLQAAYYQKLVCHCQLRQFEPGKEAAEKCLELIENGNVNWFKYYEMYFMLAMYTGNYKEALEVFYKVTKHKRFGYLTDSAREVWLIYEAYLYFIVEAGLLDPAEEYSEIKSFRLGRFLNETEIFSKDKSGMNVAIIIFQIIYFMVKGQYGKVVDKSEGIQKYCTRYLKEEHTARSYHFIRGLLAIAAAGDYGSEKREKAESYKDQFTSLQDKETGQTFQIEIIPYETLWDTIFNASN
jgi:hypothetical protein